MITTNWSISQLFLNNKQIDVYVDGRKLTTIKLPSIREITTNNDLTLFYNVFDAQALSILKEAMKVDTSLAVLENLLVNPLFTNMKEFSKIHAALLTICYLYIEGFKISDRILQIHNTKLTVELWDTIVSLFRQASALKEQVTPKFANDKARELYEKQLAAEAKIAKMRSKDDQDSDRLMKICLLITYAFPSWTVNALLDLTMAQLVFLQGYAAKACAYETESTAYANGNLKKPPKFFLE